jgi:hypothetical protein
MAKRKSQKNSNPFGLPVSSERSIAKEATGDGRRTNRNRFFDKFF